MKSLALAVGLAVVLCASAVFAAEVNLPVTKVTSFSSGVSYFEHNGKVTDNAEVSIKFKTDQMNDVLMSLVVLDLGQGSVGGVTYGSQEPLARALKSFGIDISGDPTLAGLLRQVRGAEVAVSLVNAADKITGKIVSVETKTRHILPSNTIIQYDVINVLTAAGIRSVSLEDVSSIALTDEKLNTELNKALGLLVESRDTNRKPVQISFTGKGQRDVRVGYISEAPIWKTSYRLVLAGKDAKGVEQTKMQGWAIVDNTSDQDWENVELTLVSGRPISFIQDLYTPLYVPRPVVVPELYASLRPPSYDEGLGRDKDMLALESRRELEQNRGVMAAKATAMPAAPGAAPMKADRAADGLFPGGAGGGQAEMQRAAQALATGVASIAQAQAVGDAFAYKIKNPVNLPRRKAAMLPIINESVQARRVSIYNESVMPKNPLLGLWLTNSTKDSLLAGPVTVLEGATGEVTFAGDARFDNMAAGDKRLLSFAIDQKVLVDPTTANPQQRLFSLAIVRGVLIVTNRIEYTQTYVIKNKADQPRTLVIEYPRRPERKLLTAEPAEQTPSLYRFEVDVPADKQGKFEVREEQTTRQDIAILPTDIGTLEYYSSNGEVPAKVREALVEAICRRNDLSQAQRDEADTQKKITDLRAEQNSVRANLTAFTGDRSSEGYQTFSKKMLALEKQIEDQQKTLTEQHAKSVDLRKDLEDYLSKLNIETLQATTATTKPAK